MYPVYFQTISVINNTIHVMSDEAFCGLTILVTLILKQCKLNRMPPVDRVKDTLQVLNVNGNYISKIPQHYFQDFTALKHLVLSENQLTKIPDLSPAHQTLQTIMLSSNNIITIPFSLLDHAYPSLKRVSFSNNQIKMIPNGLLAAWPRILRFSIDGNKLTHLDIYLFRGGNDTSDVEIHLHDNPWRCDAAFSWFAELKLGNYISMYGATIRCGIYDRGCFRNYEYIRCAGPEAYALQRIKDLGTYITIAQHMSQTHNYACKRKGKPQLHMMRV